jgi:hypothetical protein
MSELKTSFRMKSLQWTLGAFGGGAGVVLGIAGIRAMIARPEFLPQLLSGGFLGFSALIVGMVIASKKADAFQASHIRSVVAQEHLAQNVGNLVMKISTRDEALEQRAREQELTLNHLARQCDEILRRLPHEGRAAFSDDRTPA